LSGADLVTVDRDYRGCVNAFKSNEIGRAIQLRREVKLGTLVSPTTLSYPLVVKLVVSVKRVLSNDACSDQISVH
jgi:hypothetical protein